MSIRRIFVEKRPGFDIEASRLCADIRENLRIPALESVRIWKRYDIEGLQDSDLTAAIGSVFAEPNLDDVSMETLPDFPGAIIAVAYLPGQYDQRADSAAQCVQLLTQGDRPTVACATLYGLAGPLTQADIDRIQAYLINPVESHLASLAKPDTLGLRTAPPADIPCLTNFRHKTDAQIAEMAKEMSLAMTPADLCFCRDYYRKENRDPTLTEIRVIDTYWSDHCRHTTFLTELTDIEIAPGAYEPLFARALSAYRDMRAQLQSKKPTSLMDMGTIAAKHLRSQGGLADLDESEEINACSIVVPAIVDGERQEWLVMFKNETHNHPTEIEPFGGAATCLGGAIRDPLSGRSYVYQAMRVTGSGDPRRPIEDTIPGKLPQRKICTGAAAGYSSYGNQIGLATGLVREIVHDGYVAKRLEIGAVVGAAPRANVRRDVPAAGDIVVLLGGRTGRDGCGGATGSSKAHTLESLTECGAEVQKGNPPTERKLQRLFRNPAVSRMIKRCNDFGAGGVCVAIGELAPGIDIDLGAVPRKYEGLDGTELAISESQERMAVVLAPEDVPAFLDHADAENLEATRVAVITDSGRMRMTWRGNTIVDIARSFLDTNGVTSRAVARIEQPRGESYLCQTPAFAQGQTAEARLRAAASDLNLCVQRGLVERFDATIGAASVLMPYGGVHQQTQSDVMVAKLPVPRETSTCTIFSYGFDPALSAWSPYHGAAMAVLDSVARIVASGGEMQRARLTFQEFFPRLREDPARWGLPVASLLGAIDAQRELGVAAIGGKDSMSGSFQDMDVPPTLVSFALCPAEVGEIVTNEWKGAGHALVRVELERGADGMPKLDRVKARYDRVTALCRAGRVHAAQAVGLGGVMLTALNMAAGNRVGARLGEEDYRPAYGDLLLEMDTADVPDEPGFRVVGETTEGEALRVGGEAISIRRVAEAREAPLSRVYPTRVADPGATWHSWSSDRPRRAIVPKGIARPRVLIPVFPGTNCENDSARAFEMAGAVPRIVVVNNLSAAGIEASIRELCTALGESQILMLPGGFSGGDEPDGSGKFIATTFRNPRLADALTDLIENRDGLVLGICNGFQALMKLGLLTHGRISKIEADAPTLTFNAIGRHVSCLVRTRVASVMTPWMAHMQVGDVVLTPVSHGEGRFVATREQAQGLFDAGQVVTQYVTPEGFPTTCLPDNPNGSVLAIEGLCSPDGRIFGRMGHTERIGEGVYKNVPGKRDTGLFESGVGYFR